MLMHPGMRTTGLTHHGLLPIQDNPCVLAVLPFSLAFHKYPHPASLSVETQQMEVTYESLGITPFLTNVCGRPVMQALLAAYKCV